MRILLTFNGDRDPDYVDSKTKEKMDGPILTLLTHNQFEVIELFFTPDKAENVTKTIAAITGKYPSIIINRRPVQISDPTNYQEIMSELRRCNAAIRKQYDSADYFIFLSPGTPQMHSSWLLLAASGEVPAKLYQMRDPRQQKEGQCPVTEIDPQSNWFPHVATVKHDLTDYPTINTDDIETAIHKAGIVGSNETIKDIIKTTVQAAYSDSSIIIFGESGTGKERLAHFIHAMSPRSEKKLITINCAAIPDNLVESELFGHERGAFTGATVRKSGKFEDAHEGTLFLDEIGDMNIDVQTKILRAIQEGEFYHVGGKVPITSNIRIIAATHRNLLQRIREGLFREDLFYRLNVIPIILKPLRERRQDIGILAKYFVAKLNEAKKVQKTLTSEALELLSRQFWKNNIRELNNIVERAHVMTSGAEIKAADIIFDASDGTVSNALILPEICEGFKLEDHIQQYRDALVDKVIKQTTNKHEAAQLLGVTDAAISQRVKRSKRQNET